MSPHALTFPVIMLGLGLWQFRRAGRMARINAKIAAASVEERRIFEAHGYPPTDPVKVRILGALLIAVGVGYFVAVEWLKVG
jgi:hypothetical protein